MPGRKGEDGVWPVGLSVGGGHAARIAAFIRCWSPSSGFIWKCRAKCAIQLCMPISLKCCALIEFLLPLSLRIAAGTGIGLHIYPQAGCPRRRPRYYYRAQASQLLRAGLRSCLQQTALVEASGLNRSVSEP